MSSVSLLTRLIIAIIFTTSCAGNDNESANDKANEQVIFAEDFDRAENLTNWTLSSQNARRIQETENPSNWLFELNNKPVSAGETRLESKIVSKAIEVKKDKLYKLSVRLKLQDYLPNSISWYPFDIALVDSVDGTGFFIDFIAQIAFAQNQLENPDGFNSIYQIYKPIKNQTVAIRITAGDTLALIDDVEFKEIGISKTDSLSGVWLTDCIADASLFGSGQYLMMFYNNYFIEYLLTDCIEPFGVQNSFSSYKFGSYTSSRIDDETYQLNIQYYHSEGLEILHEFGTVRVVGNVMDYSTMFGDYIVPDRLNMPYTRVE